jgi:hypothetical protein
MPGKYYSVRDELIDHKAPAFDEIGDAQTYGSAYKLILDYYGRDCVVREGIMGFVDVEYFPTMIEGKRNPAALDRWAEVYNEESDWRQGWDEVRNGIWEAISA